MGALFITLLPTPRQLFVNVEHLAFIVPLVSQPEAVLLSSQVGQQRGPRCQGACQRPAYLGIAGGFRCVCMAVVPRLCVARTLVLLFVSASLGLAEV